MTDLNKIKPLNNKILFQFVEDMTSATFQSVSPGGIAMVETQANKVDQTRWGKVLATGPDVSDDEMVVGEYILIEALGWTNAMTLVDTVDAEKFWFTQNDKVICVSDTLPDGL